MPKELTFRLFIDTGNDAFQPTPQHVVANILREIARYIERTHLSELRSFCTVLDENGNDVGRYAFKRQGE